MKRRLSYSVAGLLIFTLSFMASLIVHDYLYEKTLRSNIYKVKVGMSETEVIKILGKPTQKLKFDSPEFYWCYETNSLDRIIEDNPDHVGCALLKMSSQGKVVEVNGFRD